MCTWCIARPAHRNHQHSAFTFGIGPSVCAHGSSRVLPIARRQHIAFTFGIGRSVSAHGASRVLPIARRQHIVFTLRNGRSGCAQGSSRVLPIASVNTSRVRFEMAVAYVRMVHRASCPSQDVDTIVGAGLKPALCQGAHEIRISLEEVIIGQPLA